MIGDGAGAQRSLLRTPHAERLTPAARIRRILASGRRGVWGAMCADPSGRCTKALTVPHPSLPRRMRLWGCSGYRRGGLCDDVLMGWPGDERGPVLPAIRGPAAPPDQERVRLRAAERPGEIRRFLLADPVPQHDGLGERRPERRLVLKAEAIVGVQFGRQLRVAGLAHEAVDVGEAVVEAPGDSGDRAQPVGRAWDASARRMCAGMSTSAAAASIMPLARPSFVPKIAYTVRTATPAPWATSRMVTLASPRATKRRRAASRTRWRVSCACSRRRAALSGRGA